jgi:hypothetical protein
MGSAVHGRSRLVVATWALIAAAVVFSFALVVAALVLTQRRAANVARRGALDAVAGRERGPRRPAGYTPYIAIAQQYDRAADSVSSYLRDGGRDATMRDLDKIHRYVGSSLWPMSDEEYDQFCQRVSALTENGLTRETDDRLPICGDLSDREQLDNVVLFGQWGLARTIALIEAGSGTGHPLANSEATWERQVTTLRKAAKHIRAKVRELTATRAEN